MPEPFMTAVRLAESAAQMKIAAAAESSQLKNFKIISNRQNIQLAGLIMLQVSPVPGPTDPAIELEVVSWTTLPVL
jgi:hypothetical protein